VPVLCWRVIHPNNLLSLQYSWLVFLLTSISFTSSGMRAVWRGVWHRRSWFAGSCPARNIFTNLVLNFSVPGLIFYIRKTNKCLSRFQWLRGLRGRSATVRLLWLWVLIPPGAWMFVCCECCVLSGRGLCDELITRPEESYRMCCVVVCDLESSWMRRPWPALGRSATRRNNCLEKVTEMFTL